jgi:hypothetical protein
VTPSPNKALGKKGDFTRIAETMRESGHALVQRLGITKGMKARSTSKGQRAERGGKENAEGPTSNAE